MAAKATIFIGANTKGANTALSKTSKGMANFTKSTIKAGKKISKSLLKMTAAFTAMAVVVGKVSVDAFLKQEFAEKRLEAIAKTTIKATDAQIEAYRELATELAQVTTLSDDVIMAGQSQIASFTTNSEVVSILTEDLIDFATAQFGVTLSQEQMISTTNMVGKALTGQLGAMAKAGVLVNDEMKAAFEAANTEQERAIVISQILKNNYGGLGREAAETARGGMQQLKNQLTDIAETVGAVIVPAMMELAPAIKSGVEEITPALTGIMSGLIGMLTGVKNAGADFRRGAVVLAMKLVDGFMEILPELIKTVSVLLSSMVNIISKNKDKIGAAVKLIVTQIGTVLLKAIPEIIAIGIELFTALLQGLAEMDLATLITDFITTIVTAFNDNIDAIIEAGAIIIEAIITGMAEALPLLISSIVEMIPKLIETLVELIPMLVNVLVENLPLIVTAGLDIMLALLQGMIEALPIIMEGLIEVFPTILDAIIEFLPQIIETILLAVPDLVLAGIELIVALIIGIGQAIPDLVSALWNGIKSANDTTPEQEQEFLDRGKAIIESIAKGFTDNFQNMTDAYKEIWETLKTNFTESIQIIKDIGINIVGGIVEGITSTVGNIWTALKEGIGSAIDKVKLLLGIASPSKLFAGMGKNIIQGMSGGIIGNRNLLTDAMDSAMNALGEPLLAGAGGSVTNNFFEENTSSNTNNFSAAFIDKTTLLDFTRQQDEANALEKLRRGVKP